MSRAIPVASGTADAQAFTGAATLVGLVARETDAVTPAVASLVIRDGTAATDPIVAVVKLRASEGQMINLPAVSIADGIFVDRSAGTSELVLYIL